jgi:tetratricopeptide (TPR) repeat protein
VSLLVEAFENLPKAKPTDDLELWEAGAQEAFLEFYQLVKERYTEGTLQRLLLSSGDATTRQAAALALGSQGTMASNALLSGVLKTDPDEGVRIWVVDSLWEIWFRGNSADEARGLRVAMGLPESMQQLAALNDLIEQFPGFAEAYNQRAILQYRRGNHGKAVADCERALQLNPVHFGAASGMGQCYLRMNKPHAALRAFAHALELNPYLVDLHEMVKRLRNAIGEK